MADIVSSKKRSEMMSGIRGKDTRQEILIRKALFARGYRYRLHKKDLPGKPDIVFPKYKAAIEIQGCFWHGHDCHLFKWPKSREDFWREKISGNRARDRKNRELLNDLGWRVLIIRECSMKGKERIPFEEVIDGCEKFISGNSNYSEIRGKQAE